MIAADHRMMRMIPCQHRQLLGCTQIDLEQNKQLCTEFPGLSQHPDWLIFCSAGLFQQATTFDPVHSRPDSFITAAASSGEPCRGIGKAVWHQVCLLWLMPLLRVLHFHDLRCVMCHSANSDGRIIHAHVMSPQPASAPLHRSYCGRVSTHLWKSSI